MLQRLMATYVVSGFAFFFIAFWMKKNGAAFARNPAWQLISTIRDLFVYSWVLLLLGAVVYLALALVEGRIEINQKKEEERQAKERERLEQIRLEQFRMEEEQRAIERSAREKADSEREKIEHEDALRKEIEQKKIRSADDAVESALNEFG